MRRVVVTGMGLITPLGNNINDNLYSLKKERIGISSLKNIYNSKCNAVGLINNFQTNSLFKDRFIKKYDLFIQYGISAAIESIIDSNYNINLNDNYDVGVIFGSGIGGLSYISNTLSNIKQKRVNPHFINGSIISSISSYISKSFNITGCSIGLSSACTTSAQSILLGFDMIRSGKLKAAIVGGAEKASCELGIKAFSSMNALSTCQDAMKASRPWDLNRDGFVLSDGAGSIFLEEYLSAKKRNAKIYAEILGCETNSDAHSMVEPRLDGKILLKCMKKALEKSRIISENICYINAHATSTQKGDLAESIAINSLIGKKSKTIISSTKSMTGHLLGAAGVTELILTILMMDNSFIPKNLNLEKIDGNLPNLNYITESVSKNIKYALSNSIVFGGINCSIIIKKI
jgi:3-oxoacyl-[acyl-carrier-protein] synthase II